MATTRYWKLSFGLCTQSRCGRGSVGAADGALVGNGVGQPVPVGELAGLDCDTVGAANKPTSTVTPTSIVNFFVLRRCPEGAGQTRRASSTCMPPDGRP